MLHLEKGYEAIGLIEDINFTGEFLRKQEIRSIFNNYDVGGYLIYHLHDRENSSWIIALRRSVDFSILSKPIQQDEELRKEASNKYGFNVISSIDTIIHLGLNLS